MLAVERGAADMKTLGVIANTGKPNARAVLDRLRRKSDELGLVLMADADTASYMDAPRVTSPRDFLDHVDAVMALGGDGTMLRTVRGLDGRDTPVIGVNIGSLGFLTSVAEEELDRALACLAADDFLVSDTVVANATVIHEGQETASHRALNDIVIARGSSMRVVTLTVSIDGDVVTSYVCDGLIVSTPAGSTGHSLSAGGPIVIPETGAFVINVICPHTLSSRPMVLPDSSEIVVTAARAEAPVELSLDGQVGNVLQRGDKVRIWCDARRVRFLHLPGHSYFGVLRQKLHWSGSNV